MDIRARQLNERTNRRRAYREEVRSLYCSILCTPCVSTSLCFSVSFGCKRRGYTRPAQQVSIPPFATTVGYRYLLAQNNRWRIPTQAAKPEITATRNPVLLSSPFLRKNILKRSYSGNEIHKIHGRIYNRDYNTTS